MKVIKLILIVTLVSLVGALLTSFAWWNFFFHRPNFENQFSNGSVITAVHTISPVNGKFSEGDEQRVKSRGQSSPSECNLATCECLNSILLPFCASADEYYCTSRCIIPLPVEETPTADSSVPHHHIRQTLNSLAAARGFATLEALTIYDIREGDSGRGRYAAVLEGIKDASDDDRYYALALLGDAENSNLLTLSYYYDVAGLEPVELLILWPIYWVISAMVTVLLIGYRRAPK